MQTNIYTLPELTFVGGKTQELRFNLKDTNGEPYNASGSTVNFSICDYSYKTGAPILSLTPSLIADESGMANSLYVTITSEDTINLFGKYIYQITIIDISGRVEIPNQGIMNITKNINTSFISSIE